MFLVGKEKEEEKCWEKDDKINREINTIHSFILRVYHCSFIDDKTYPNLLPIADHPLRI